MTTIRRILAPTDFSPPSSRTVARAVEVARARRAVLVLLHVLAPVTPMMGDGYIPPSTFEKLDEGRRRAGQRRLAAAANRAAKAGVRVTTMLVEGVAAEQIARAARRCRADLIVMGTHGRTGFSRFLLGSVAQRVLTLAPCDALTVR